MGNMDTLKYILDKYNIANLPTHNAPIELPITRVENHCASGHEAVRNAALGVASGAQ